MSSLKDCPFCNSTVYMQTHVENKSDRPVFGSTFSSSRVRYEIRCNSCDVEMFRYSSLGPIEDIKYLQDRWNNRV